MSARGDSESFTYQRFTNDILIWIGMEMFHSTALCMCFVSTKSYIKYVCVCVLCAGKTVTSVKTNAQISDKLTVCEFGCLDSLWFFSDSLSLLTFSRTETWNQTLCVSNQSSAWFYLKSSSIKRLEMNMLLYITQTLTGMKWYSERIYLTHLHMLHSFRFPTFWLGPLCSLWATSLIVMMMMTIFRLL